ncbi:hypothetical protein GGR56DRAFT_580574 [Xylariaceae sp. FL0804]|nr:hypothetical protein GGR56DRAFT_580574 [Xylariaceae sp. FL0804]
MPRDPTRRSSTSPAPSERLKAAKVSSYRRAVLRRSISYETIVSCSCSFSSRSPNTLIEAVSAVEPETQECHHTEQLGKSDSSTTMEVSSGPGLRSRKSSPSLRAIDNRPSSIRSASSRAGTHRHALLRLDSSRRITTEKDLPIPPVLSHTTPAQGITESVHDSGSERPPAPTIQDSQVDVQSVQSLHQSIAVEAVTQQAAPKKQSPGGAYAARVDGRAAPIHERHIQSVKVRPALELLLGDHRHHGHFGISKVRPAGPDVEPEVTNVFEGYFGGQGPQKERVVERHYHSAHQGHSRSSKVRPAFDDGHDRVLIHTSEPLGRKVSLSAITANDLVLHEHRQGHHDISKVRSYMDSDTVNMTVHEGESPIPIEQLPETSRGEDEQAHLIFSSDVHPSYDTTSLNSSPYDCAPHEAHAGHTSVEKVQHFHGAAPQTQCIEQDFCPRIEVHRGSVESSAAAQYWGFHSSRSGHSSDDDKPGNNEDGYSGQGRGPGDTGCLPEIVAASSLKRGSVRPSSDHSSGLSDHSGTCIITEKDQSEPFNASRPTRDMRGPSLSPSSGLPSSSRKGEVRQPKLGSISERIDPRRTATWLRQLLGYNNPDSPNSPNLTKLPEKAHPRHQAHDDYSLDDVRSLNSRVSTFSGQNTTNVRAMDDAMLNLEQLLSEALDIANRVSEQDNCGHEADAEYSVQAISEDAQDSTYPDSVHESTDIYACEDVRESNLAGTPPNVFVGAVESLFHGCEELPLRALRSRGLGEPDMHSGNIRGPALPTRDASIPRNRRLEYQAHACEQVLDSPQDDCVLPMPPPDRQLRRQRISHAYDEDDPSGVIQPRERKRLPNSREVREYIRVFHQPPVAPRQGSRRPDETDRAWGSEYQSGRANGLAEIRHRDVSVCSLDGGTSDDINDFSFQHHDGVEQDTDLPGVRGSAHTRRTIAPAENAGSARRPVARGSKRAGEARNINLHRKSHVSIMEGEKFNLAKSVKRQPTIARDWSPIRKRLVASVACISTALIGTLVGIYAGLVPSIQYYLADFSHYTILGNVGFYLGMALTTFFCWPLPLLHGRKPYIVVSLCVAMPLLFPQALAASSPRSPDTIGWRWALLLPRALMGCALGLASMNFHSILTDLFGASLMSTNPHQEVVDHYDVRRHGGGLGVWLGIWTWCFIGSLGIGFLIGAVVINYLPPAWGLYISIMIIAAVLVLNVLCPEVRRSGWRRSVAEIRTGATISRRVARGEIMMHRVQTGPRWWTQEVYHGAALSLEMLRQPGFLVMAFYSAWIYAQIVLIIVLLGSLTSKYYRLRSPLVGAAVASVAIGALAAVPFQKANLFSRARNMGPLSNRMTLDKKVSWTSHLVRRAIFTLVLPIGGVCYAIVSAGPPMNLFFPCFFAALVGFLSCLAISECNGILMET